MYIMLTERCNMRCAHCCFACTHKGQDMSRDTFIRACSLADDYGDTLTLGGGEPTLHPDFFEYLEIAASWHGNIEGVTVITNGHWTQRALRLREIADEDLYPKHVYANLSTDHFHAPVSDVVRRAYSDINHRHNIDNYIHGGPIPIGRAKTTGVGDPSRRDCPCDDPLFITPDGTIWGCGCRRISYGTVRDPDIPDPLVSPDSDEHQYGMHWWED